MAAVRSSERAGTFQKPWQASPPQVNLSVMPRAIVPTEYPPAAGVRDDAPIEESRASMDCCEIEMRAQPLRMSGLHVTLCVMCTGGVPVGTDVLDPWNALADWAGRRRPDVRSRSTVRGVPRPQTRCSAKKHHTPEQIIVPPQRRAADIERAAQVSRDLLQAAIDRSWCLGGCM
jgi:hypothetical protein